MPAQPQSVLLKLLGSVEADLDRLGLQAQLLRHLAGEEAACRPADAERVRRLESTRNVARPGAG